MLNGIHHQQVAASASNHEASQAANVSDTTFAREMWRHNERGNIEAAQDVRGLWKYSRGSEEYGSSAGPLTAHEIDAFAKKSGGDVMALARAVERAALIKAYTLLPEIRQAEAAKRHRRYFRDGLSYGLAVYSGAIRALTMGQIQGEIDPEYTGSAKPRRADQVANVEAQGSAEVLRPGFEVWAGRRQFDLRRENDSYANLVTAYTWMGWLAGLSATGAKDGGDHA
jgi:hypothetical protein